MERRTISGIGLPIICLGLMRPHIPKVYTGVQNRSDDNTHTVSSKYR